MKKHMIFSLKNILKRTVSAEMQVGKNEPFYLLEGRACLYYDGSNDKYMLSCYEEGYFQASLLEHHGIKLHAFVGSTILTLEADFLKD